MIKTRLIARIDVKNEFAIKGIHLEGLRKVGDPNALAVKYYQQGIDELIFMDAVAAYYDRNTLHSVIEAACKNVFVPITVGGGIRTIEDIHRALTCGADKVAINTQAVRNPSFVTDASKTYGAQCIVGSLDAKQTAPNQWEAYIDNGREPTGIDAVEWAIKLQQMGVGELLITSIDKEGTKKGFDIDLIDALAPHIDVPYIICGGAGNLEHFPHLFTQHTPSASLQPPSFITIYPAR